MKKTYFFIDDVIWLFRDLTRSTPASIFDHPFLGGLREIHEAYGLKVQLNCFYSTDEAYGGDVFTLSDMTDAYRAEWEASSDWLRLAFHAEREFPDFPHINAEYNDVKVLFERIRDEVFRFAGEKSFTRGITPHWMPMSEEGVRALYDCGVRLMNVNVGDPTPDQTDCSELPNGYAGRLLCNRKESSKIIRAKNSKTGAPYTFLGGYNLIPFDGNSEQFTLGTVLDENTGMRLKLFHSMILNSSTFDEIEPFIRSKLGADFIGFANHEQYFYPDYIGYQPDYMEKIHTMARLLHQNGYESIFIDELV